MSEFGGGKFREEVLSAGLTVAKAWEMLHDSATVGKLDTEAYLELCLRAGYSQEASQRAAKEWANRRLDAEMKI